MRNVVVLVLLMTAGCYPTLPAHVGEGTEVLEAKRVGLTFVGGGAGFADNCCKNTATQGMGGLEIRGRIGIGHKQEIGASVFGGAGAGIGGGDPPFIIGGKGTYKIAPAKWIAIIGSAGAQSVGAAAVATIGGDATVILAPYTSDDGMQLYSGVKAGFAIPVLQNASAVSEAITIPVGFVLPVGEQVRFLTETGFVSGFTQLSQAGGSQSAISFGGYGLLAFQYRFR